jgi:hypothetical protein
VRKFLGGQGVDFAPPARHKKRKCERKTGAVLVLPCIRTFISCGVGRDAANEVDA